VRAFRKSDSDTPIVLMGYLNPVEMRGASRYAQEAAEAGVDGVLLVDLPPEEASPMRVAFNANALNLISLAAPTTSPERLARLANESQGYLYYVSFAGVTGASNKLDAEQAMQKVRALCVQSQVPVLIGFGIKDAASAAQLAPAADGVVVGSALVETLAGAVTPEEAAARAGAFLRPIREALDA
jgi:tryptophan synthase alpha chain